MKGIIILFVFFSTTLFNGCYTIVSIEEEPEQLAESTTLDDESSGSYFDEELYAEEIDSGYKYINQNTVEEDTELGFFEILITELISGLSNVSYSEDVIIYTEDSGTDNSSASSENSTKEREYSSTRNTGDRNYNGRK